MASSATEQRERTSLTRQAPLSQTTRSTAEFAPTTSAKLGLLGPECERSSAFGCIMMYICNALCRHCKPLQAPFVQNGWYKPPEITRGQDTRRRGAHHRPHRCRDVVARGPGGQHHYACHRHGHCTHAFLLEAWCWTKSVLFQRFATCYGML